MSNLDTLRTILSNDLVAKWINLRDYALDTLSANSDIKALMDESDKKIEPLVPTMTSNTTPEGECFSSTIYSSAYDAYKAFDGDASTSWVGANNQQNDYVGYIFTKPVEIKYITFLQRSNLSSPLTWCIKASNDGVTYTEVSDDFITNQSTGSLSYTIPIDTNGEKYSRYILYNKASGNDNACVNSLQFYTYAPKSKYGYGEWALMPQVPKMTSNTAPYGEVFSNSNYGQHYAWYAFDGGDPTSNYWEEAFGYPCFIGYKFVNPTVINSVSFVSYGTQYSRVKDFKVQGSNDTTTGSDGTWTDIYSGTTEQNNGTRQTFTFDNDEAYLAYRLYVTSTHDANTSYCDMNYLQFYAWQPKGNVPVMTSNTAPYGEAKYEVVSGSGVTYHTQAYNAFSGVITTGASSANTAHTYSNSAFKLGICYEFVNPVIVTRVDYFARTDIFEAAAKKAVVQGSNDDSTWTELCNMTLDTTRGSVTTATFENSTPYKYYRVVFDSEVAGNYSYVSVQELQFYGRELSVSVPTMTSNTAPWGEAFLTKPYPASLSNHSAYEAFTLNMSQGKEVMSSSLSDTDLGCIAYDFEKPVKVLVFGDSHYYGCSFTLAYSDDKENWTDVDNWRTDSGQACADMIIYPEQDCGAHRYWGIHYDGGFPYTQVSRYTQTINRAQFYGLDYSEREFAEGSTMKYIYDHGVELETITRGGNTITFEPSEIILAKSDTPPLGMYKELDFTPYDIMYCRVGKHNSNNHMGMAAMSGTVPTSASSGLVAVVLCGAGGPLLYVDVSTVSQTLKAAFNDGNGGAPSNPNLMVGVTEWWLE